MTDYNVNAMNFLNNAEAQISIKFSRFGPYFPGESESRNVYDVTITRDEEEWEFTFGDSIKNTQERQQPTAYDVLACLTKYDPGTYEDFMNEYGYERNKESSRLYKRVRLEWDFVEWMFDDCLEELRKIW